MKTYYYLDKNYQQQGPIPAGEFSKHGITHDTQILEEGTVVWHAAGSVAELSGIFSLPPAPPPRPPAPPTVGVPPVPPAVSQPPVRPAAPPPQPVRPVASPLPPVQPVAQQQNIVSKPASTSRKNQKARTVAKKKKSRAGLIAGIIVAVGVLLAGGFFAYMYFFLGDDALSVSITPENPTVTVGETVSLSVKTEPSVKKKMFSRSSGNEIQWKWTSANANIATVNSSGTVTGISEGCVTITATADKRTVSDTVRVTLPPVQSIVMYPGSKRLTVGDTFEPVLEITPENADKRPLAWVSSDTTIATVSDKGLVSAVGNGNAVISAYTGNGISDTCFVQVVIKKLPTSQTVAPTPAQLNDLLVKIRNSDDHATDRIRSILGNGLRVEGAANISNVQQLITDVSNGSNYKVAKVNTNDDGKVVSISVNK